MLMIFVLISFAGARCTQNFIKYEILKNFYFTNKCLGPCVQRETILPKLCSNQPVNAVEIPHYNSTPVHESDDNELEFEKFFSSHLFHDLVNIDINDYNQSNDTFESEELQLPSSFTARSEEDEANPQNSKLDYAVIKNSSTNATTNTEECSLEKTPVVSKRGRKRKRNVKELTDLEAARSRDKHPLREPCSSTCKLQCSAKINPERRRVLWSEFWHLSYNERRNYVFQSIEKQTPQKRVVNPTKNRKVSIVYCLKDEFGSFNVVCKTFF